MVFCPRARVFGSWPTLSFITIIFGLLLCRVASAESEFYRAAVLEHVRFEDRSASAEDIVQTNLRNYELAAKTAASQGVDIIVYPEFGLFFHTKHNRSLIYPFVEDIPDPSERTAVPCDEAKIYQNRPILYKLSCLAKENGMYLVANMVDKKTCVYEETCDANDIGVCEASTKECREDNMILRNTNVVFDRKGSLISKYYKTHLYFEFDLDQPLEGKAAYFETEFGLFTTFICFDISFFDAVKAVEQKPEVTNVAYPTYWYDHLPFALATQIQEGWALTHNVNLLAANAHLPGTGTLGSGIYSGSSGALVSSHNPDGQSKLLISNVPKVPGRNTDNLESLNVKRYILEENKATEVKEETINEVQQCSIEVLGMPEDLAKDYRCFHSNISGYVFQKLSSNSASLESCSNEFCCSLTYEADSLLEDFYLGTYSNITTLYESFSFRSQACFLARCDTECTVYPAASHTVFRKVELRGNFNVKYVYQSVVHDDLQIAPKSYWSYDMEDGMVYNQPDGESPLLFIGLHGRSYEGDVDVHG